MLRATVGLRWIAFHRTDPRPVDDRIRAAEEGLAYARETGDAALEGNALRAMGALLIAYGEVKRGVVFAREALDQASRIGDSRERHLATIEAAQTVA